MSLFKAALGPFPIAIDWLHFPGGEWHPRLSSTENEHSTIPITIEAQITDADGIVQLLLLNDAIRRLFPKTQGIKLYLKYFPYARQDRVAVKGEALGVKVMADLVNSCNFDEVKILNAHSPVAPALINKVKDVSMLYDVSYILSHHRSNLVLVAPDAGAEKKVFEIVKALGGLEMITATKRRDTLTGEITGVRFHPADICWKQEDCLIVDDICDGGATFTALAKELREWGVKKIYLYVTHGIFSKGLDVFNGLIDKVYCSNVWPNIEDHPLLERI